MHKALAHNQGDDVAVAVTAISAGEEVLVVYVEDDGELTVVSARCPLWAQGRPAGAGRGRPRDRVRHSDRRRPYGDRARRLRPHAQRQDREVVGMELFGYRRADGSSASATT